MVISTVLVFIDEHEIYGPLIMWLAVNTFRFYIVPIDF